MKTKKAVIIIVQMLFGVSLAVSMFIVAMLTSPAHTSEREVANAYQKFYTAQSAFDNAAPVSSIASKKEVEIYNLIKRRYDIAKNNLDAAIQKCERYSSCDAMKALNQIEPSQ